LARRDTSIPGLATVLDGQQLVRTLRKALPAAELQEATATYVRYKPGTSCLVAYDLVVGGRKVDAYAKAYRRGSEDRLDKALDLQGFPGPLGPGRIVIPDLDLVVSVFPNDSSLKTLPHLIQPDLWNRLQERLFARSPTLLGCTIQGLRYKPERRYVARLLVGGAPQAVLKVYTENGFPAAQANSRVFKSRKVLVVPHKIGSSGRRKVLAFEWLGGRLLSEALMDPGLDLQQIALVGAALAEVHAHNPSKLNRLPREAEVSSLLSVAAGLSFLCPDLARRFNNLARALAARLLREPPEYLAVHGDFYAKQVLLMGENVGILDFDTAVAGDPAADLGLFIAHLERGSLHRGLPPEHLEPLKLALLAGYEAATRRSFRERVAIYTASGLLRLAPHPFRNRHDNWPADIEQTLARAEAIYTGLQSGVSHLRSSAIPGSRIHDPMSPDPTMPFLTQALDPYQTQTQFRRHLTHLVLSPPEGGTLGLKRAHMVRHKPGRRCLIEYELVVERPSVQPEVFTLLGKARARGLDRRTYETALALWNSGFNDRSDDGVSIPEPVGVVPEFQMWLHRRVPGLTATSLLAARGGPELGARIAAGAHKLHSTRVRPHRRHTMADELRILHEKLSLVSHMRPELAARVSRLLRACDALGAVVPEPRYTGIHRDLYADQVLVDNERLYILDLDLYCEGDPGLDIGNFLGHVQEWSLRKLGHPDRLRAVEAAMVSRFVELSGEGMLPAIHAYTLLTLARHIFLSTRFPDRMHLTEPLLQICEERFAQHHTTPALLLPSITK
jgi:Ser/Thr protein kinase RdoA (MazF antagonist)